MNSVSLVICCYNSASRLPAVLQHIAHQKSGTDVPCEVIVVDNACTDDTAAVAQNAWPADAPFPLRVVSEPRPGLSWARLRGLAEARHDVVSFIDDDNWVSPDWVGTVSDIMSAHPEVGACGGLIEPVFESPPPRWITHFLGSFAVGAQAAEAGDVSDSRGVLWGAGLTVRRQAWEQLRSCGFQFILSDRTQNALDSGGDCELCLALRLGGWRLWYDPSLQLRHFIPATRVSWPYIRRLHRAFGRGSVWSELYGQLLSPCREDFRSRAYSLQQLRSGVLPLLRHFPTWLLSRFFALEGNPLVPFQEMCLGRIDEIVRKRSLVADRWASLQSLALKLRTERSLTPSAS